jgi:hypothetical protein
MAWAERAKQNGHDMPREPDGSWKQPNMAPSTTFVSLCLANSLTNGARASVWWARPTYPDPGEFGIFWPGWLIYTSAYLEYPYATF